MILVQLALGMYPLIKDEYAPLRTATSFGKMGYGPKIIKKKEVKTLKPKTFLKE